MQLCPSLGPAVVGHVLTAILVLADVAALAVLAIVSAALVRIAVAAFDALAVAAS